MENREKLGHQGMGLRNWCEFEEGGSTPLPRAHVDLIAALSQCIDEAYRIRDVEMSYQVILSSVGGLEGVESRYAWIEPGDDLQYLL